MKSKIENIMKRFNFGGHAGCLLYWKYRAFGNGWWVLTVKDQPFWSSKDHEALHSYRKRSCQYGSPVEPGRQVDQEWFAGLAALTRVADQRTIWDDDQCMGQLVVPVFDNKSADQIFLGVIELVTVVPKACYVEDLNQIHNLLKVENLATKPLAKTVKVSYLKDTVKFPLPFAAGIPYLLEEVTKRFKILNQKAFRIQYKDGKGNLLTISGEDDPPGLHSEFRLAYNQNAYRTSSMRNILHFCFCFLFLLF